MEREHVIHTFEPVFDSHSQILVLGTFPSVKSRESAFYYGHPQNRFWRLLALLTGEKPPESIEEKKALLLREGIALWDVVASCDIQGSSDTSIRNVTANDLRVILERSPHIVIFSNGKKAYSLYQKYCFPMTGKEIRPLPSTSPANAACPLPKLAAVWGEAFAEAGWKRKQQAQADEDRKRKKEMV